MVLTVLRSTVQVFKFLLHLFVCLECVCILVCHSTHVDVRGPSLGVCSLLPCGFWKSNTGHQTWQQEPLPTDHLIKHHAQVFYGLLHGLNCSDGFLVVTWTVSYWEEIHRDGPFLFYYIKITC